MSRVRQSIRIVANACFLLIPMAMIGSLGYLGYRTALERYHAHRLEALGAIVHYGAKGGCRVELKQGADATEFMRNAPVSLQVLSESIRNFHRGQSIDLRLDGTDVCDNDLRYVQVIDRPIYISLENTGISDYGLQILEETKEVTSVNTANSLVSEKARSEFYRSRGWRLGPDGKFEMIRPVLSNDSSAGVEPEKTMD